MARTCPACHSQIPVRGVIVRRASFFHKPWLQFARSRYCCPNCGAQIKPTINIIGYCIVAISPPVSHLSGATLSLMIFVVETEERTLRVFQSDVEAVAHCEGLDVEAGVWLFWNDRGEPLEPHFSVPNQRGLF